MSNTEFISATEQATWFVAILRDDPVQSGRMVPPTLDEWSEALATIHLQEERVERSAQAEAERVERLAVAAFELSQQPPKDEINFYNSGPSSSVTAWHESEQPFGVTSCWSGYSAISTHGHLSQYADGYLGGATGNAGGYTRHGNRVFYGANYIGDLMGQTTAGYCETCDCLIPGTKESIAKHKADCWAEDQNLRASAKPGKRK